MTAPVLVPEFSVGDAARSIAFYCDVLGFSLRYSRPEQGFAYLEREGAALMLDQIGLGRDFQAGLAAGELGRGVNVQICVSGIAELLARVVAAGVPLVLPLEEMWYRKDAEEVGNRQFVVADPDGYLLRFYQDIGTRIAGGSC